MFMPRCLRTWTTSRSVSTTVDSAGMATRMAIQRCTVFSSTRRRCRSTAQRLDGQAFARAGWQIGVWGEDSIQVNLTGKTAGQYFAFGLTDKYQPYTESYRNLEQLQVVFENNGYWFEGEQAAEGPLAADFSRRIIKMHADVELNVGNFKWYGMFDSLTLSQSADEPFLMTFQISFIAWKERFRKESPYPDLIDNDTKRGADYGSWQQTALAAQKASQQIGVNGVAVLPPEPSVSEIEGVISEETQSATPQPRQLPWRSRINCCRRSIRPLLTPCLWRIRWASTVQV